MFRRLLFAFVLLALLGIGASYIALMHTPLPLRLVQGLVKKAGIEVTGLKGNLSSGFSVTAVRADNKAFGIWIDGVRVKYSDVLTSLMSGNYVINEVNIDRAKIEIRNVKSEESKNSDSKDKKDEHAQSDKAGGSSGRGELFKVFRVERVNVLDVELVAQSSPVPFTSSGPTSFKMKRLQVEQLEFTPSSAKLGRFQLESSFIDLSARGLAFERGKLTMAEPFSGTIYPALYSGLRKPLPFSAKAGYADSKPTLLANAFDNKLTIELKADYSIGLTARGLTIYDYFNTQLPFANITASAGAPGPMMAMMGMINLTGTFMIGSGTFTIAPPEAQPQAHASASAQNPPAVPPIPALVTAHYLETNAKYTFTAAKDMRLSLTLERTIIAPPTPSKRRSKTKAAPPAPRIEVVSDAKEILSTLYFRKPASQLTTEESASIAGVAAHFSSAP